MHKPESLAKAAAVMAIVAALATMLAVNVKPPVMQKNSGREARVAGIPVPATPKGGVGPDRVGAGPEHVGAGVAQGRGAAVQRREAGGGRAPNHSSESAQ